MDYFAVDFEHKGTFLCTNANDKLFILFSRPQDIQTYNVAGTIHDYVVAALCGHDKPLMSAHNAASWGYFNTKSGTWNLQM